MYSKWNKEEAWRGKHIACEFMCSIQVLFSVLQNEEVYNTSFSIRSSLFLASLSLTFSPPLSQSLHISLSLFHAPEIWRLVSVASPVHGSTHPAPYCSGVPLHPSLNLSSFLPPLLASLASFGSWWGVTALPLSGRESPVTKTKSVCLCVRVDAGPGHNVMRLLVSAWRRVLYVWVCSVSVCGPVWPVEVTDIGIVLSQQERKWFTCQGSEGQEGTDKCTVLLVG